jgi:Fe-S cluster biogenesis protein NfuA
MDAAKTVSATFAINTYTLTVNSTHGAVTKVPDQATYTHGASVVLTMGAVDAGWTFSAWSGGGCMGTAPCTVPITANTTVTALFTQNEYTLDVTQAAGGTITWSPEQTSYHYGDSVTFTATPDAGWSFVNWSGDLGGSENPLLVTIHNSLNVSAVFSQNMYPLTTSVVGLGSIARNPDAASYPSGTVVTLTPQPASGYHFVEWTGACTGSGACSVTMDAAKTVSATFAINTYTLTVTQPENGSIAPPTAVYDHGSVVDLTATPATGYHFVEWTGACTGSGACSVTMDAAKTVSATFAINTYTLTVTQPENGSIAPPTAVYDHGSVVDLTATPATGYHFVEWTGACTGSGPLNEVVARSWSGGQVHH